MRFFTLSQALVFTLCTPFLTGAHATHAHEPSHLRRHAPFPAPARIPEPIALAPAKIWDFYFAHAGAPPPSPPSRKFHFHGDAPPAGRFPGAARSGGPRPARSAEFSSLTSPANHDARATAAAGAARDAAAAAVIHDTVPSLPRGPPSSPGSGSTTPASRGSFYSSCHVCHV